MIRSLFTAAAVLVIATSANAGYYMHAYVSKRSECGQLSGTAYCNCLKNIVRQLTNEARQAIGARPHTKENVTIEIKNVTDQRITDCFNRQ